MLCKTDCSIRVSWTYAKFHVRNFCIRILQITVCHENRYTLIEQSLYAQIKQSNIISNLVQQSISYADKWCPDKWYSTVVYWYIVHAFDHMG